MSQRLESLIADLKSRCGGADRDASVAVPYATLRQAVAALEQQKPPETWGLDPYIRAAEALGLEQVGVMPMDHGARLGLHAYRDGARKAVLITPNLTPPGEAAQRLLAQFSSPAPSPDLTAEEAASVMPGIAAGKLSHLAKDLRSQASAYPGVYTGELLTEAAEAIVAITEELTATREHADAVQRSRDQVLRREESLIREKRELHNIIGGIAEVPSTAGGARAARIEAALRAMLKAGDNLWPMGSMHDMVEAMSLARSALVSPEDQEAALAEVGRVFMRMEAAGEKAKDPVTEENLWRVMDAAVERYRAVSQQAARN